MGNNYSDRFIRRHRTGYSIAGITVGIAFIVGGIILVFCVPPAWPALLALGGIGLYLIIGGIIKLVKG